MRLIDADVAIAALEKWESENVWDEWCDEHKEEKDRFNISPPSDVLRALPFVQTEENG